MKKYIMFLIILFIGSMHKVKFREYMTKEEFLEFYINLFDYYNNGYC